MSDLINFNDQNENIVQALASPLIPPPESSNDENLVNTNEAGPMIENFKTRLSLDNNPFDIVMKKVIEFEKNKEDPFESVCQRAMRCNDKVLVESEENFLINQEGNETVYSTANAVENTFLNREMDTLTDLNTLIKKNIVSDSCDIYNVPHIAVSSAVNCENLSILSNSSMNDSLLEQNYRKDVPNFNFDFNVFQRCKSQTDLLSPKRIGKNKRSVSVTESVKNSIAGENSYNSQLSFGNLLDKAFRKSSVNSSSTLFNSNINNSCSSNSQFDVSGNKQHSGRFNSDSSVFSLLSNISSIPSDSLNQQRKERFSDESSSLSSISSLSAIPSNITSSNSSIFSNDTMNKGFINSKTHLVNDSNGKSPFKSDVIEKFYEIKTRIFGDEIDQSKSLKVKNFVGKNMSMNNSTNVNTSVNNEKSNKKLVEIDETNDSVFSEKSSKVDIISNEALILAQEFEKMSVKKDPQIDLNTDDGLFLLKTELNFDDLPPSDDENVDILIDIPSSSETKNNAIEHCEQNKITELKIENIDSNKKAEAALLLSNLEDILKENNNPNTSKVLNDLQKLLGIECYSNAELLQACLQHTIDISHCKKKSDCEEEKKSAHEMEETKLNMPSHPSNEIKNTSIGTPHSLTRNNNKLDTSPSLNTNNILNSPRPITRSNSTLGTPRSVTRTNSTLGTPNSRTRTNSMLGTPRPLTRTNSTLGSPRPLTRTNSTLGTPRPISRTNSTLGTPRSISRTNSTLGTPSLLNRRRTDLVDTKKRFSSNPELNQSTSQDKIENNLKTSVQRPPLTRGGTYTIKPKLKKNNPEVVQKKGPIKAVIPMGSMQKIKTSNHRFSVNAGIKTPTKPLDSKPTFKLVSSTPNQSAGLKNQQLKPSASSTPNISNVGKQRFLEVPSSKLNRTLSPQKKALTPKKEIKSRESYLPKYSPRPSLKGRNHSLNDLTKVKSPETISTKTKTLGSVSDLKSVKSPHTPKNWNNLKSPLFTNSLKDKKLSQSTSNLKTVKSPQTANSLKSFKSPKSKIFEAKISTENHVRRSVLSPNMKRTSTVEKSARLKKPASIQTALEKENYI